LAWLADTKHLRSVDDLPVWSIPCFYIRRTHRRHGVMAALIEGAIEAAAGAPALEAYPIDTAVPGHPEHVPRRRIGLHPTRLPGRGTPPAGPPDHATRARQVVAPGQAEDRTGTRTA
jgi:GNAT superfamily N-acetyltransferase